MLLPALAAAASLVQASALRELQGLVPALDPPPAIDRLADRAPPPEPPQGPPVASVLDPRLLDPGEATVAPSKAEWRRRLRLHGGKASFALLSPVDASRELLLFVPGVGMTFQDAYGLAVLDDSYQVAIAVVDQTLAIPRAGEQVADALAVLLRERGDRGRALRVIGHSFGAPIAQFMLEALALQGVISAGGVIPKALFLAMDGPWRGVDMPFPMAAPAVRQVSGWLLTRLPLKKPPTQGTLSIFNRGPGMKRYQRIDLPPEVTTHFVTVLGNMDTGRLNRHYEPVANWYSQELGAGELERLWWVLRRDRGDWNQYDTWALTGLARKQGLQNLVRTLERDADYGRLGWRLRQGALESATLEEFRSRYDDIIAQIVDTFQGHHTHFMWTDPSFLPYARRRLASW